MSQATALNQSVNLDYLNSARDIRLRESVVKKSMDTDLN